MNTEAVHDRAAAQRARLAAAEALQLFDTPPEERFDRVGTFCVVDTQPREMSAAEISRRA